MLSLLKLVQQVMELP